VVSGDRFVSTDAESRHLQAALPDALAVEMEGAAIAQVCHDYGVPFAAVRTISDRADDAAHGDFESFVREVASRYSSCAGRRVAGHAAFFARNARRYLSQPRLRKYHMGTSALADHQHQHVRIGRAPSASSSGNCRFMP
jgi:uridine phosphorylase